MKKILLVCTGNTCRSAMAKGLFEHLAKIYGVNLKVDSAGLSAYTSEPAANNAIEVMQQQGIDITGHRSRQVQLAKLTDYDLILTMTVEHKERLLVGGNNLNNKLYTLKEYAKKIEQESKSHIENLSRMATYESESQWDVFDPYGQSIDVYREAAQEIATAIKKILAEWQ